MEKNETAVSDISEPLLRYLYFPMKEYFPFFLDHEYFTESLKVTPPCFIKEMEFTTQERHKQLLNPLRKCKYGAEPHLAPQSFKPFPEIIIFQKFIPGESITVTLNILNCSEVLKPLHMSFEKSENFTVTYASKVVITRVAPGMSVAFNVKFCAHDQKDYGNSIYFNTDKESFIIPIKAIGSRPLLDIPDHIYLPTSPVRVPATKLLVVRNIGNARAVFTIVTESPFTVKPKEGILGAQEVMQVIITFMHYEVGDFERPFMLKYETGEKLYSTVHGSAENVNIFFEDSEIWFEDTYFGLTRQCSITLNNQSEHLIPYKWKKFASLSKEEKEKERLKESYKYVQEIETLRSTKVEVFEVADVEAHSVAYERIYEDELKSLETDDFLFNDSVFVIDQLVGEIWPFSSLSMLVTFKPQKAKHYMLQAFCEIGGIENRLELMFNGRGRGPYFQLNLDVLDISYVFLSSKHSYEVIAFNKGHIPGTISFVNQELIFGGKIFCEPLSHMLEPEECKSFALTFSSNRRGEFNEDILFRIEESSETVKLIFRGSVITPTLHFNKKCVQWGEVAVGFPSHRKLELHNLSVVPVAFSIRISDDGVIPSLTYKHYATYIRKPPLQDDPQEFQIVPSRGVVPEYSNVTLEVTLVTNVARERETEIMVDMWDSKTDSLSLPVSYNAKFASIVCLQDEINIRFCFINCQYNRTVTLQNLSKIPGFFHIVPQEVKSSTSAATITFSAEVSQGVLRSLEKIDIPLTIMTNAIGKQSEDIYLLVMGIKNPVPCCTVICNGQGPVLSVDPTELVWGETVIIRETKKDLILINDSPIPATFTCIIKNGLPWSVDPSCGTVLPAARVKLKVYLYLRERGPVNGNLEIQLQNGKTTSVPLSARGIGICIDVDPPCFPTLDLGVLYSHCLNKRTFTLTNKGLRRYRIFTSHNKHGKPTGSPKDAIFKVHPRNIHLIPDETTIVTLDAQYDSVGEVEEIMYAFASDEGKSRKVIENQCTIIAKFIAPVIKFSKPEIVFSACFGVQDIQNVLEDDVEIFNKEVLPLDLQITINSPFYIKPKPDTLVSKMDIHIASMSSIKVVLCFEPPISDDMHCTITDGALLFNCKGQPTQESFPVKGGINYPNAKLIPKDINFGCIPAGTVSCEHSLLTNVSLLPITYWWYWLAKTFKVTMLEPTKGCIPPDELIDSKKPVETSAKDEETASEKIKFSQVLNVSEVTLADIEEARKLKEASKIYNVIEDGEKVGNEDIVEEKIPDDKDKQKEDPLNQIIEEEALLPKEDKVEPKENSSGGKKLKAKTKEKPMKPKKKKEKKKKKQHSLEDIDRTTESGLETITESVPTDVEDVEDESKSYRPTYMELKDKLFPLIDKYFEPAMDLDIFNILPIAAEKDTEIDDVFELAPCFGTLNRHSLEYLTVSYCGKECMAAEVTAMCRVDGGPTETLTVKAMSSNLSYYLDHTNIDFGNQVFCELCEEIITLYNTGYLEFDFLADASAPPVASDASYILQAGMLIVEPKTGHVNSKSKVELTVRYVPGISGRFKEEFKLEIGYLLPITINVEGNGVFPQLYVLLPHILDPLLPVEDGYAAVASLTNWKSPLKCDTVAKESSRLSNPDVCPEPVLDFDLLGLLSEDWDILMDDEYYPPDHEIYLAVERVMAYKHIEENPYLLLRYTNIKSFQTIPLFTVPPYVLDFGLVIVNTTVHYNVELYNYGPVPICVRKTNIDMRKFGLQINFPQLMNFPVDTHGSFQVTFNPRIENFPTNKEIVKFNFALEVDHGARIPILIQAIVTLPFLTVSTSLLEFGRVKCGECKSMPLILKNEGLVPCKWQAFLLPSKKSNIRKPFIQRPDGDSTNISMDPVFSIKHEEDIFNPNMVAIVEVFFQPKKSGNSLMNLILSINKNPETIIVMVKGEGIEPCLNIDRFDITFPPCLPYPEKSEEVFHISNPCPFPVEIFFCDYDSQILEEERILRALCHYYGTNSLRLPVRNPGDKLSKELYEFYDNLVSDVNTKLAHQVYMEGLPKEEESEDVEEDTITKDASSKLLNAEASSVLRTSKLPSADASSVLLSSTVVTSTSANLSTVSALPVQDLSLIKAKSRSQCSKFDVRKTKKKSSLNLSSSETADVIRSTSTSVSSNFQNHMQRAPDFIENLVHEYIDELKNMVGFSCENYDPIKQALISTLSPKVSEDEMTIKANILIVFHGAPKTEYVHLAYKTARALELLPLNVDKIILESAAAGATLSAMKVRDQINTAYKDYITKYFPESSEGLDEFPGEDHIPVIDPFEELMKKVQVLENAMHMKKKPESVPTKGKKIGGKTSSAAPKTSSKRGQQSEAQMHNVFSFPTETLIDIITQRFHLADCEAGIVIDGLRSKFFNSGSSTLTAILKAAGNIKYIHFIVLYNSLFYYFNNLHAKHQLEEERMKGESEARIQHLLDEGDDEIDNFNEEDSRMYEHFSIIKRKELLKKINERLQKLKEERAASAKHAKHKKPEKSPKEKHSGRSPVDSKKKLKEKSTSKSVKSATVPNESSKILKKKKKKGPYNNSEKSVKTSKSAKSSKSEKSSKSSKSEKSKDSDAMFKSLPISNETRLELKSQFEAFEYEYQEMLTLAECWDQKKGMAVATFQDKTGSTKKGTKSRAKRIDTTVSSAFLSSSRRGSVEDAMTQKPLGFPIWIVDCKQFELSEIESIIAILKQVSEIEEAHSKPLDWTSIIEPESHTYYFANYPAKREIYKHSPYFTLECNKCESIETEDQIEQTDSPEEGSEVSSLISSQLSTSSQLGRKGKKRSSSGMIKDLKIKRSSIGSASSISSKKGRKSSASLDTVPKFKSRWILEPGEKLECKLKFFPNTQGRFSRKYGIEIMGWHNPYLVIGNGIAALPSIIGNPQSIFDNVSSTKEEGKVYTYTYFQDTEIFDFGAALCTKIVEKRAPPLKTSFVFKNYSELPVEMSFFFEKPFEKVDVFGIEPTTLVIQTQYARRLNIWAAPSAVGSFSEKIYCCIKNNPVILPIKLTCQGVKCDFMVQPKSIVFDGVLLYQKKKAYLTCSNKTYVPVIWRFIHGPFFTKNFKLSTVDGVLDYKQSEVIQIEYVASKVEVINKEPLKLEVYGMEGRTEPLHTEIITISAESFDIMLDVLYSEPNETHVNFGVIKMGVENNKFFQLQNKGNHEFVYKLELSFHQQQFHLPIPLHQMLTVQPQSDVIKSGKPCVVKVTFIPKCELQIKEVPLIHCLLFDVKNPEFIISKIPLNVTVESYYSRCVISPSQQINFGTLPVGSKKTIDLYVENVGTFNFKYTIVNASQVVEDIKIPAPVVSKKSAELKKADKTESKAGGKAGSKAAKSNKEEIQTLSLGVFTIYPSIAEVKPSEATTLHIDCHVGNENKFCEQIRIHISEANPADTESKSLKLLAQCCIPVIDFEDIETIFQEQYICQYLSAFESPVQSDCHCAYAKKEGKLKFYRTCVGLYAMTRLKIQNKSLVPCDVIASVGSNQKHTPRLSRTEEVFSVTPLKLSLPPYSVDYFTITFRPTSIESYSSNLEISTESSAKKEKLVVTLCGEGNMPQVAIISPKPDPISESINITFPSTYVGQESVRALEFQNIGFILSKVVLELSMNLDGHFVIYPDENTVPLMKLWQADKPIQHTTLISLNPQQTATILIHFQPHQLGCFKTQLKLSIVDNPFENLTALLYGESFMEDITIDGVDISESKTWAQKRGLEPKPPCYQLNYSLCYVNTIKKSCFKITNHSRSYTFRFQWAPHPNILFTPTIGHISPRSSTNIITSFFTPEPLEIKEVELLCSIAKIKLKDKNPDTAAWDDRQTSVKWGYETSPLIENPSEPIIRSRSCVCKFHLSTQISGEPCHEVIPGSLKDISLLVSACADYSRFDCPIEELNFKDTLMFQDSIQEIMLTNIGIVPLEFKWQVTTNESYPVRPSSAALIEVARSKELRSLSYVNPAGSGIVKIDSAEALNAKPSESTMKSSTKMFNQSHILSMGSVKSATSASRASSARYIPSVEVLPHKRILGALSHINYLYAPKQKKVGRKAAYYKPKQPSELGCPLQQSEEELDLFSKTAEMSDRTNDTWLDGDYMPFVVEPEFGTLAAQESITLKIKFVPLDVFVYRVTLVCVIKNMDPFRKPLEILMNARSLMPYCHFDIVESDYLTSGRRNNSLPGPMGMPPGLLLDPETRTLEFNVLGIGVISSRTFHVINPTDVDYVFQWLDVTLYEDEVSSFHCSIVDGELEAGGMIEMKFTLLALTAGIHESFWKFSVPAENIVIPFLLVGIVTEPSILLQPSHIEFCPTVKGVPITVTVTLINNEDISLNYSFKPESLQSSGLAQGLSIKPMAGVIKPNSNELINVKFNPISPGSFVFDVKCSIKRLLNPLDLFISGSCYKVQPMVSCSDLNTKKWNLNPNVTNELDFGSMVPKKTKTIVFNLANMGQTGFHYGWIYNNDNAKQKFKFNVIEKGGFIATQSRVYCKMNLTFLSKSVLKNFEVTLRIPLGPEYRILVHGSATMPLFEFSFSEHNFGPCFIQKSERLFNKIYLKFFNKDDLDLALECSFEEKPHLIVTGSFANTVKAKDNIPILIAFRPREEKTYEEILQFNIGGSVDKQITIKGEGVPLKLMLVNPEDKCINFGSVQVDQREMKLVQVINNSIAPAFTLFSTSELFAGIIETPSMATEDMQSVVQSVAKHSQTSDVRIYPSKRLRIAPHQIVKLWVKFFPSKRMSPFTEKVYFQVNDHLQPLFIIKGSCFGSEFSFDKTHLTFGAVVQDCTYILKTTLLNVGDIGSRFRWEYKPIEKNFTITPRAGYCSPGTSAVINVEFHPTSIIHHFVYEAFCKLENYDKLTLTLSGSCVPLPDPKEVINFTTNVREVEKKVISLQNRSNETWSILPEIKGDYFSGPEIFTILPNEIGQYEIIYSPMIMTAGNKHTGSIIFKLPDGQGLLYDFLGIAEPPLPNEKKNLEIPTKTAHTEYLVIKNWLQMAQRFKVITELVKADKSDTLYTLHGNEFITIPGSDERNYKFIIKVYKECNLIFKVMFVNEDGGEYQYYDLFIKVVKSGPVDVIKLNTYVRIPIKYELVLENPLITEVTFIISCFSSEIKCPSPCLVLPNSVKSVHLEYIPLQPGESVCKLEISSHELGLYSYELNLTAAPPSDEKPIHFTTNLGSQSTELAHFQNLTKNKAEFICTVDEEDFQVDKAITLQGNSEGKIAVSYEPSSLEGAKAFLSLSSLTAGDFTFLLVGTCNKPQPQGPFILRPGGNVAIIFRNPFKETKVFSINVDKGIFIIKNKSETIKARKDCRVVVSFPKSIEFISFPVTGKLEITCTDEMLSEFSWVYYLKGIGE